MSILKRRADVSSEKFASEWIDIHSFLVKRLPGVRGYTQNLIFDRAYRRGKPATYAELAIDGIVELWFSDLDSMSAGFASDAGETLMTHATEFIARSQLFL
jgi:EthD domain